MKFLRRTPWAREKVEGFYLYKSKRLPKPDDVQYELPPRDRIVPMEQKPRTPAVLTTKTPEEREEVKARREAEKQSPVTPEKQLKLDEIWGKR